MKWISLFCILFLVSCYSLTAHLNQIKIIYRTRDYARAFDELYKIRNFNNPKIQYALGYMYYYGIGTAEDESLGIYWIKIAANKCYPPAIEGLKRILQPHAKQYVPLQSPIFIPSCHQKIGMYVIHR